MCHFGSRGLRNERSLTLKSFTDAAGQSWDVVINVSQITLIRSRLDLCLFPLSAEDAEPLPGEETKPKADRRNRHMADLERLQATTPDALALFVSVLWTLVEKQAEGRSVTPEQFAAGLEELDAYMAARSAVDEELTLFSLSRPQRETAKAAFEAKASRAGQRLTAARAAMLAIVESDESTPSP